MKELLFERLSIILPITALMMSTLSLLSTFFLGNLAQNQSRYNAYLDRISFEDEVLKRTIRKPSFLYIGLKRIVDILIGLELMFLTSIVFLFVGPIIYMQDPGPIFYKQKIVGFKGKIVYVYKFRSFTMDSIINSKKGEPLKLRKYFRREDIFLLPVAFSVLKGDISLVGLSQHSPGSISEEYMRLYQYEKPGLVYLKMVKEVTETEDVVSDYMYDFHYLNSRSLAFDWKMFIYAFISVGLSEL